MADKDKTEFDYVTDIAGNWGCTVIVVVLILVAGIYFILELLINAGVI